ncbi:MAG: TIM barrel protein [Planctomycetota bacterium]
MCGQGDMDFTSIFDALRNIKYSGFLSVELYPYQNNPAEAGQQSLDFLKKYI